ncbi:MAG: dienelactone hydrolase family protein [Myxococcaceae bacterium]|nr:dienelactone hydrolase family protein [Myxococcaceae bacterium]
MRLLLSTALLLPGLAMASLTTKNIPWDLDGAPYEGMLVFDDKAAPRPALVMVPNWLGVTPEAVKQAELVAARGYVVLVADVYGTKSRPKNRDEAGKSAGALKSDRPALRRRVAKALEVLLAQKSPKVDASRVGAIGFCFGGTAVLELARSGAPLGAVVSFHGGLSSPTPDDAKSITAKVLVLHGADDPSVPPDEVAAFESEMRAAKVDWQLVSFGGAVHSFTDPNANVPGRASYHPVVAARAWAMMDALFAEVFATKR